jgi:hypothetical protein
MSKAGIDLIGRSVRGPDGKRAEQSAYRDTDTPDSEHSADVGLRLLDLDEAVELLRGAYARRTLQNMAWAGKVRHVGRGERMRFVPSWLLEDLAALCSMEASRKPTESTSWSFGKAIPSGATTGASAPSAPRGARTGPRARRAAGKPGRGSGSSGSSAASATGGSRAHGASKTRGRFFKE